MFSPVAVLIAIAAYMAVLFGVALWGDRSGTARRLTTRTGVVYALSLVVYCTSWTFYGSVGKAATGGFMFLAIYFGPTLCILFWWTVLRKLVRIKNRYRITSIADFVASRYSHSEALAALVTVMALVGIVPYIALQLKALISSFNLITGVSDGALDASIAGHVGPIVVVVMIAFTILFGVRRLDATERHQGMMVALAGECVLKLVAFVAAGLFVTYGLFDGVGDIFARIEALPAERAMDFSGDETSFVTWCTFTVLAMSAILFLPRQFHAAVIENSDERHVRTAQWMVPLYLFLINLFVFPIAAAGLVLGHAPQTADTFVLLLPLQADQAWLSMLVFIGGFSAATGMIMISSMAMSTMVTNHLMLPVITRVRSLQFARRRLLQLRWLVVALFVAAGYGFTVTVGESYMLVKMGMISFAAVLQFAPVILGGLFWRRGNRAGALTGLSLGFALWFFTLMVPAFVGSGWVDDAIMTQGLFGISALRPEAMFGLSGLDSLSHAVVVTMLANIGGFVVVSVLRPASRESQAVADDMIAILEWDEVQMDVDDADADIALASRVAVLETLFMSYMNEIAARDMTQRCIDDAGLTGRSRLSVIELSELRNAAERRLSGSIGSAMAHRAVRLSGLLDDEQEERLAQAYSRLLAELQLTPRELRAKIDFHQGREEVLREHADKLESVVRTRTHELVHAHDELLEVNNRLTAAMQAAEEANHAKSAFLANMSHEIRTPMTAILGYAEILRDAADADREHDDCVETICRNGEHLLTIINDILDISKLEAGKMEVEQIPCQPAEIVSDVVGLMRGRAEAKQLALETEADGSIPTQITSDPTRLRQILVNLVGNAIKFTETGSVTIVVSYDESSDASDGSGTLYFRVRDTGIGMTSDQLERLFNPFEQADASMSRRYGGTGLGTSISRHLAELLGGTITAESTVGRGSEFTVCIATGPVERSAFTDVLEVTTEEPVVIPVDELPEGTGGDVIRVLVVEDGPDNQRLIRFHLERAGYEVSIEGNGAAGRDRALDALRNGTPFDVIFMDMQMPIMDGYTATRELRRAQYDGPIIALTAHAMSSDRDLCLEAGCDDYLTKPIDREQLLALAALAARGDVRRSA